MSISVESGLYQVYYMRAFAEAYPDEQFMQQAAAQIPWFHNCVILDKVKKCALFKYI